MFETLINYVFMFFVFSAIGWTVESTYRSLGERRIINSGFLHGPVCPIYGTGGLVFHVFLVPLSQPIEKRLWLVLLLGMVLADTVEYFTSYIMEKLFHARWWDYSNNFLNIHGRICLRHTIYWGVFSFMYVYVIAPIYEWFSGFIPQNVRNIAVAVILVLFVFDLIMTVKAAINIQKAMTKLEDLKSSLLSAGEIVRAAAENIKDSAENKVEAISAALSENEERFTEWKSDVSKQFADIRHQFESLISGGPDEGASKETKRLLTNSGLFRYAEKNFRDIENFWEELKKKIKNEEEEKKK